MNNRIATSQRRQMRALAVQGIFATDCHAQLRGLLQQHLGPAHAALLAEPQHDATTGTIDWYTPLAGKAIPCQDLPPEESRALASRAVSMAVDIEALARRLRERQQDAHALSGGLLELCCLHHDVSDLYSVGGQPVLINWGFAPGGAGAEPQDLTRLGAMAAPAPAAVPPAMTPPPPSSRTGCAGWLLPLLLLLLLLWLLLSALGWVPFWWPASCVPQPDKAALQAEADRALRLDDELQALLRQLREKAALCRPAPPPAPEPVPEPEPEPPVKKPEADVVEPFFGESPVEPEPEPAPQPKPEPRPEPKAEPRPAPQTKPRKGEEMQIPKDAAQKKDLSFLEGCWVSETGLFSHPANKPVIAEYCFDKNGRGRRFVREEGGRVCSGPSQARFNNGRLQFDAGPATCPRGSRFVPQRVECQGSQDRTQCRGQEQDGKRSTWKARFRRK